MIDLHSHILPGIDDGAATLEMALEMARIASADGIRTMACTPHIYPGMYDNSAEGIRTATAQLQQALQQHGIALQLVYAADAHLVPNMVGKLQQGLIPTFNGGRYFLLEPPHHVAPPRFEAHVLQLLDAGYVPIITHPERLTWIKSYYEVLCRLVARGAWVQITAGSMTGSFGAHARYWAQRMLQDGLVHVIASDAHGVQWRAPLMQEAVALAAQLVGEAEAQHMVSTRPAAVLDNTAPELVAAVPYLQQHWLERLWRRCLLRLRARLATN